MCAGVKNDDRVGRGGLEVLAQSSKVKSLGLVVPVPDIYIDIEAVTLHWDLEAVIGDTNSYL